MAEAKRLFVADEQRGRGVGGALLLELIRRARAAGYRSLVADTLPAMASALALYEKQGFRRTGPYSADATRDAIYLRLALDRP